MKDYLLRVLKHQRDVLEKRGAQKWKEYVEAEQRLQTLGRLIKSMERINALLIKNTISTSEKERLSRQLAAHPSLEELRKQREDTQLLVVKVSSENKALRKERRNASKKLDEHEAYCRKIDTMFGPILAKHLKPPISSEVILQLREDRLDIYWGGKEHPLGQGHGHCIFTLEGLQFRRNPE
jgi:chromosome segregation ATPase